MAKKGIIGTLDKLDDILSKGNDITEEFTDLSDNTGRAFGAVQGWDYGRMEAYNRRRAAGYGTGARGNRAEMDYLRSERELEAARAGLDPRHYGYDTSSYRYDSRGRGGYEPYYPSRTANTGYEPSTFTANGPANAAAATDEASLRKLLQFMSQPPQTAEDNQRFQQAAAYYVSLGSQYNPQQLVALMNEYPLNDTLKGELTRGIYANAQSRGYHAPAPTGNPRNTVPDSYYRNAPMSQNQPDTTPVNMASVRDTYLNSLLERSGYNTYGASAYDGVVNKKFDATAQAALHDWQKAHGFAEGALTKEQLKELETYASANAAQFDVAMAEEKAAPRTPGGKASGGHAKA